MRTWASCLLGLAAVLSGCKDNQPLGCRIAQSASLPASRLTLNKDVALHRAGNGFVLVGVEGDEVRWAPLAQDGTLGTESVLTVPQRAARPPLVFGATAKSAPGDQLVVAYAAPKAGAANELQIMAITQSPGATASAPAALVDLPAGVDPAIVRMAMGTSQTGERAVLTWGFEGQDASPQVLILKGDAQPVGPAAAVYRGPGQRGTCLAVSASRSHFAITFLETAGPIWRAFELNDDGGRGFDLRLEIDLVPTGCISSAPTQRGYVLAYQNNDGTFFSDYIIDKGVANSDIVAGVLEFGGAARQPRVACISPMGSEFGLLYDRSTGPEVWRIDAFGNRQGSALVLPSIAGSVGPLAAVPGKDTFFATYLDQGRSGSGSPTDGNSMGSSRYFVRVDCPMAAPYLAPDAAIDAAAVDGK